VSAGVSVGLEFPPPDGGASVVLTGKFFRVTVGEAVEEAVGTAVGVIHAASIPPRPDHKSYRACPMGPISLALAQAD
jgi:hypothetical protein